MERFNLDEKHIKYEESEGYEPTDNIKALGSLVEHSGSKLYRPIGLEPTYSKQFVTSRSSITHHGYNPVLGSKSRADSFEPENRAITPTISSKLKCLVVRTIPDLTKEGIELEATRRPWEKISPPPYPSLVIETGTNCKLSRGLSFPASQINALLPGSITVSTKIAGSIRRRENEHIQR